MKNIKLIFVIILFLIMPSLSHGKISSIADSDLGNISAQDGSITISNDDLILRDNLGRIITNKPLKSIATDGYNYWDPDHGYQNPYTNYGIKNDKTKYPGTGYFDKELLTHQPACSLGYCDPGYFGYGEVLLTTDGLVRRSGSITMQVFTIYDDDYDFYRSRNIWSRCKLQVMVGYRDMDGLISDPLFVDTGNMEITAVLKLSSNPDLDNQGQTLGRIYTGRVTQTGTQGMIIVHSHNQLAGLGMSRLGPVTGGNPIP